MFYTYNQNNSGGRFVENKRTGIGQYVIIEADTADDANYRAEQIGIYFEGTGDDIDCPCCGDRWFPIYNNDGQPSPQIYGENVENGIYETSCVWGVNGYIHYKDGSIKVIKVKKKKS